MLNSSSLSIGQSESPSFCILEWSVKAMGSSTKLQLHWIIFMYLLTFVSSTGRDSTQQELLMETVDHVENIDAILLPSTNIGITVQKKQHNPAGLKFMASKTHR